MVQQTELWVSVSQCQPGMLGFSYSFANFPICIVLVSDHVLPGFPRGTRELDSDEKA